MNLEDEEGEDEDDFNADVDPMQWQRNEVTLKHSSEGFGLGLQHAIVGDPPRSYVLVDQLVPGMPAAHCERKIQLGSVLLEVNGKALEGVAFEEVPRLLSTRSVSLTLMQPRFVMDVVQLVSAAMQHEQNASLSRGLEQVCRSNNTHRCQATNDIPLPRIYPVSTSKGQMQAGSTPKNTTQTITTRLILRASALAQGPEPGPGQQVPGGQQGFNQEWSQRSVAKRRSRVLRRCRL